MSNDNLVERILFTNEQKAFQYRFTISDFRDETYLSIRKFYLDYEGQYAPSNEGATFPLTLENLFNLLDALVEACSKAEFNEEVYKYFENHRKSSAP